MPVLLATDKEWPKGEAGMRLQANVAKINAMTANAPLQVVFEENVDISSSHWRLTESPAAGRLPNLNIGMILVEHIWPFEWRTRDEFHLNALKTICTAWGHSKVFVWVDRHMGLGNVDKLVKQLQLGKRWKKFVLPVTSHYEPLQQDETQYTPIMQSGDDVALVVVAPWSGENDIFFHCTVMPYLQAQTHLYVPELCKLMLKKDRDVLQLACWSCESTKNIVQHFVESFQTLAIEDIASSMPREATDSHADSSSMSAAVPPAGPPPGPSAAPMPSTMPPGQATDSDADSSSSGMSADSWDEVQWDMLD